MIKFLNEHKYLILILLLSFGLRVFGISFGFPFFLHPDETKIVEPALTMAFNIKTADFNPHFFYYPHFLMYFLVIIIQIIKVILIPFGIFNSLPKEFFYFTARMISVLFGTASVFLTYVIAKKVSPKGREEQIGLMSALFLAVAFLHVRNSHYYTGDVPATFFILLSLLFFLGVRPSASWRKGLTPIKLAMAGFFCGIGISTKYYPALLLLLYLPTIIYVFRKNVKKVLSNCFIVGIAALMGFLMFTPYAVLDYQKFIGTMKESSLRSASGFMGASSNNPFYYIYNTDLSIDESFSGNSLAEGVGWGFVGLSLIGVFFVLKVFNNKTIKQDNIFMFFVFSFVLLFYVFFARYPVKLIRWLVCITPFLSILVSYTVITVLKGGRPLWGRTPKKALGTVFLLGVIIPNIFKAVRFDYALSRGDTRVRAYNYVLYNIPKGTPMIFESILIHKMVEDGDYPLFQITHDRYNTKGEIENDFPPDLDKLLTESKAKYIIINGWSRQKYFNPSSYIYFPEVSKAWRDFYNGIDARFSKVEIFDPEKNLLSGPKIIIYSTSSKF
ncbi:MAG: phospholipid carrier-dependent glycosyltransferase [Patescibacteria group bacterium]|nr:phospholipid carrier-dependent glycosyltransferase [Patescibacteria group bacterium]